MPNGEEAAVNAIPRAELPIEMERTLRESFLIGRTRQETLLRAQMFDEMSNSIRARGLSKPADQFANSAQLLRDQASRMDPVQEALATRMNLMEARVLRDAFVLAEASGRSLTEASNLRIEMGRGFAGVREAAAASTAGAANMDAVSFSRWRNVAADVTEMFLFDRGVIENEMDRAVNFYGDLARRANRPHLMAAESDVVFDDTESFRANVISRIQEVAQRSARLIEGQLVTMRDIAPLRVSLTRPMEAFEAGFGIRLPGLQRFLSEARLATRNLIEFRAKTSPLRRAAPKRP